uniref:Uncharacterized protein n=1 Tax=Glossina austeni TaxID=7395 RepID=A0A1A9VXK9_GLOAU
MFSVFYYTFFNTFYGFAQVREQDNHAPSVDRSLPWPSHDSNAEIQSYQSDAARIGNYASVIEGLHLGE